MRNQAVGLGLGVTLALLVSLFDFERYARWQKYLYVGMLALLVLTLLSGGAERSRRWIALPLFDLQTAEVSKLLLVLT